MTVFLDFMKKTKSVLNVLTHVQPVLLQHIVQHVKMPHIDQASTVNVMMAFMMLESKNAKNVMINVLLVKQLLIIV